MSITEPVTLITDYLLAVFTVTLADWLWRAAREPAMFDDLATAQWRRSWSMALLLTTFAGLAGGTVHGFQRVLPRRVLDALWLVTLESLVAAACAIVIAAIVLTFRGRAARGLAVVVTMLTATAYGVWVASRPVFVWAIVAQSVAGVATLGVALFARRGWARRLLLSGLAVSVIAAAVQQSGIALHRHFNHNDLYHVVQAVAIWLLYRGVMARGPRA